MPRLSLRLALLFSLLITAGSAIAADFDQRIGLGPFPGLPTFVNSTTLSTTPVKFISGTTQSGAFKVKIKSAAANTTLVAWKVVVTGATAPTAGNMTADYAATGASIIDPGVAEFIEIPNGRDLYLVASNTSSVNVTYFFYAQ